MKTSLFSSSIMANEIEKMVMEEFGPMCETFNLRIRKIGETEYVFIGNTVLFLLWLDRDGVSVKYVRQEETKFYAVDVGCFVVSKRGWTVSKSPSEKLNIESYWRLGCSAYALNLQKFADDVLRGQTDVIKESGHEPFFLGEVMGKAICAALKT